MSKENKEASSFLAKFKRQIERPAFAASNALASHEPPNAFRSVFAIEELEKDAAEEIQALLETGAPENSDSRSIQRDLDLLKGITAEIRSIQKQSVLLLGERIVKAREILKLYGDGSTTFTKWLDSTFSSRRTAYNCIAYFEFFNALPNDRLRQRLKLMSHKAVYMLASRNGPLEQKFKIIEEFYDRKQEEIIPIIQEFFPLAESERKGGLALDGDLDLLERILERLLRRRKQMKSEHRQRLKDLEHLLFGLAE